MPDQGTDDAADDAQTDIETDAEPPCGPAGLVCNPIVIPGLPYQDARDGNEALSDEFGFYSPCAPTLNESGAEFLYILTLEPSAMLTAVIDEVENDDGDMDVHILSAPPAEG